MVIAIERHKSGIRYRARELSALAEGDEIVADAMKNDRRGFDHRQQIQDIDAADRRRKLRLVFARVRHSRQVQKPLNLFRRSGR